MTYRASRRLGFRVMVSRMAAATARVWLGLRLVEWKCDPPRNLERCQGISRIRPRGAGGVLTVCVLTVP